MRGGESWEAGASCNRLRDTDCSLWESFFGDTTAERKPAKKVCAGCPVRLDCLAAALERGEVWGVWGGCDEVDLRRALWTDTNGTERERLRFPRCPACRARSEHLYVSSSCPLGGDGDAESVECGECKFSWSAASSVAAVKLFWDRQAEESAKVVPIKRPARVRVARGRIPSGSSSRSRKPVQLPVPESAHTEPVRAVAASGAPSVS